jgi:signal transduction histidine kinase
VVATTGEPLGAAELDGADVVRTPLPDGGFLIARRADNDDAWVRFSRAFMHEARSPLNALAIYLELLGTRLAPADKHDRPDAAPERIFARANDQIRRIEDLIRAFGELWAARGEGAELADMVRAAGRFCEHEALRLGLQWRQEVCPHAPVDAASGSLANALVDLFGGALRAPPETVIHVSLRQTEDRGAALRVELVSPTGSAIPLMKTGIDALRALGVSVQVDARGVLATFAAPRLPGSGGRAGTTG